MVSTRLTTTLFALLVPQVVKGQLNSYEIDLDVTGIIETFTVGFFNSAVDKWTSAVIGDVPDVQDIEGDSQICGPYPSFIDDLWICGRFQSVDFFGGVLGLAGPTLIRTDSSIPAAGIMVFDTWDLPKMWIEGSIQGVVLHEMGHILGLGTNWDALGLTQRDAEGNCPYSANSAASREYQTLSGCSGEPVPIEFDGGEGTRCGHFDETCFQTELMTGFATGSLPMSRVTIGSLDDLGYVVNYDAADPFTAADLDESCRCNANRNLLKAKKQIRRAKHRHLSEDGLAIARKVGLDHLKIMAKDKANFYSSQANGRSDVTFVGDQLIHVLYLENNHVHDVLVRAED